MRPSSAWAGVLIEWPHLRCRKDSRTRVLRCLRGTLTYREKAFARFMVAHAATRRFWSLTARTRRWYKN